MHAQGLVCLIYYSAILKQFLSALKVKKENMNTGLEYASRIQQPNKLPLIIYYNK